ncbi:MAG: radical SAM protein [Armatimonadetes bacterium]|nr:radical SAM protein [Armatimonadota bacterium]
MHEEHFTLLTMRPGSPPRFSGPLARVLAPRLRDNKLAKIVGSFSKLAGSDVVELLGMNTQVCMDGAFAARATGPMSILPTARQAIDGVERAIKSRGKPIARNGNTLIYTSYQPPVPTKASMKLLGSRLALELDGHPQPTVCTLQVTNKCQANCMHCSAARYKKKWDTELSTAEWKRAIRSAERMGVVSIVFTGGEPLLRPDIFELIDWVDKDEAIALMFCNGLLLDDENVKKLARAGLWCVHVSIDSPDSASHDEMRRVPGCYDKAIEGIKRARDAGMMVGISTYATPERLRNGQVVELIELAKEIRADEVTIFDVVPTGRLLHHDRQYLLTDEDKSELCRIEDEYNKDHGLPQVITQAHVNGPTGVGCYAGWCQFYMTAYGEVMPCDFTPLTFGNVRDEDLEFIWRDMTRHEAYCTHKDSCRMQDPEFRCKWIDRIPAAGPFPYPVSNFGQEITLRDWEEDEAGEYTSLGIKG